ncbi:MAG: hypothetical protein HY717_18705 [Planctomycetes bacterium]|nr:hypothetical protein [Planctomycetota bacterium]
MSCQASRLEAPGRQSGIALMVVLILFVILVLVVSQLQFSTKLEEELSEVRTTEASGSFAISAVAAYVMTLLAEDYSKDSSSSLDSASAATLPGSPTGPGGGAGGGGGTPDLRSLPAGLVPGAAASAGGGAPAGGTAAGGGAASSGPVDYLLENLFLNNSQTVNGVNVRILIRDNERLFDLNRLWEYVRLDEDTLSEQQAAQREEEQRQQAKDKNAKDTEARLVNLLNKGKTSGKDLAKELVKDMNTSSLEWVPPSEEAREQVRLMLARAILLMVQLNEENGFSYQFNVPSPVAVANAIEDYCYRRRSQPYQNTITLVTELFNLYREFGVEITPELFYGPVPDLAPGDEFFERTQQFSYTKDEFGDLNGQYLLINTDWQQEQDFMRQQLKDLQGQWGDYGVFPELGRLGNPLTRNMQELPENADATGLAVPPLPLGLKDLFCTISSGKINLNTAPAPVVYGLLLSLSEEEAQHVALNVQDYRNTYQEEMTEEEAAGGVGTVKTGTQKDLGQKKRQPRKENETSLSAGGASGTDAAGALMGSASGLDAEALGQLDSYQNYETNYFTNLRQLVLIDGEDGGPQDLLKEDEGVQSVDLKYQTPYQRTMHDLEKVVVFGSTYFTANLKIKTEKSPAVKEGDLIIHRDAQNKRLEIVQWKEKER